MTRRASAVVMPAKPPYDVLKVMAGDPVLLAASDEAIARFRYHLIRAMLSLAAAQAKKGKR